MDTVGMDPILLNPVLRYFSINQSFFVVQIPVQRQITRAPSRRFHDFANKKPARMAGD